MLEDCKELKDLMKKRPDLPVYFLVSEWANLGDNTYEFTKPPRPYIGEILNVEQDVNIYKIYTDHWQFEDDLYDFVSEKNKYLSDKEISEIYESKLKEYDQYWEGCILAYID